MQEKYNELKRRLLEVHDLNSAAAVLSWDQSTYMPPGGGPARGRQLAVLGRLAHQKLTDPALGRLLEELQPYEESLDYDSDEASLLRVTRHDYERAVRIPADFLAEVYAHSAAAYQTWTQARPANDFAAVRPYLEKSVDYSRQIAGFFPGYDHIADPLIDFADHGMKAESIRSLFAELRCELAPMVAAISSRPPADDACLRRHFPEKEQLAFAAQVVKQLGYDFERGRIDKTPHPFMTKFSLGDVRITTRVDEHYLGQALFSTIHETGHALYEQGVAPELDGTPLGNGTSAGVHESQSRLWENVVGRSRAFWEYFYAQLQAVFPNQLDSVTLDSFYRAVNKVERSLIRTDADEVTYNLHIMMRFDFELALLEGKLAVRDLPEAWRERFQADFGIAPPNDKDGVLQDVHWFGGLVGGSFQGYTLGNLMGAQIFQAAVAARPDIPDCIGRGEFDGLHQWLKENVYRHGRKYLAPELMERVTGQPLQVEPYIQYLRAKYGELYALDSQP
jgi:carboxypeptidase Taq